MTEDELRDLMGFGGPPQVDFADSKWEIRPECLAALIRFVRASTAARGEETTQKTRQAEMAALHHLLNDCITDFAGFSQAAFTSKAELDDLTPVVRQLVQFYCARPYWPAIRLLGYLAATLDEFDGDFLRRSGRGVASLSAREACNLTLAVCLDGRDEDNREAFYDDLNYEGSPEADALEMVRKMKAQQGTAAEADGGGDPV